MATLSRTGGNLFYKLDRAKVDGCVEPLVLLHGNWTSHVCFDPIVPLLNDRFTIVRCDLRGFGLSDPGDRPLVPDTHCDDVLNMTQQLGIRSFHLAGYGFGAIVAAKFAAAHPGLVRKLVLISLPFVSPSQSLTATDGRNSPGDCPPPPIAPLAADPLCPDRIEDAARSPVCQSVAEWCAAYEPLDDFERLRVPTLLLCGEEESCSTAYLSLFAALSLSDYKLCTVPDSPVMVAIDQPELTARWITNFLDKPNSQAEVGRESSGETGRIDIQPYVERLMREGKSPSPPGNELRVELMHGFHVYVNGMEICVGWNQRFAKTIFLYLLFRRSARREQLCETLWPHLPLGKARNHLRVYLSHLKKMLEQPDLSGSFLVVNREDVQLRGTIVCDALDFVQDLTCAALEADAANKGALCRKVFQALPDTLFQTIYDDWFLLLRDEWEHNLAHLAIWYADDYLSRGNPQGASAHLKQAIRALPGNETLLDKWVACSVLCRGTAAPKGEAELHPAIHSA